MHYIKLINDIMMRHRRVIQRNLCFIPRQNEPNLQGVQISIGHTRCMLGDLLSRSSLLVPEPDMPHGKSLLSHPEIDNISDIGITWQYPTHQTKIFDRLLYICQIANDMHLI